MIGGIAANNASGMCCGTSQNSYRTVSSMRIIFQDGTALDTADPASRQNFAATHGELHNQLDSLAREVRKNQNLSDRIRHKFKIKNTIGYSLNALVDYEDPIDISVHLMIGSEGTLGFISDNHLPHGCRAPSQSQCPGHLSRYGKRLQGSRNLKK
jgi:D-lactate dehydrogenase